MNIERLNTLADHVEGLTFLPGDEDIDGPAANFTMQVVSYVCGTPGCLAGHAIALFGDAESRRAWGGHPVEEAAYLLDLDEDTARRLFVPRHDSAHFRAEPGESAFVSPARAAAQLRHLAKHGEVCWSRTPA